MKCPKCNEEALFVNGKYVCVDCGIEITPEEQASQYYSDDVLSGSSSVSSSNAITDPDPLVSQSSVNPATPGVAPTPELSTEPVTFDESVSSPEAENQAADVSKPVEEYYKKELENINQPQASNQPGSGVYDFSNNESVQNQKEVAMPTPDPEQPSDSQVPASFEPQSEVSQEPEVQPVIQSEPQPENQPAPQLDSQPVIENQPIPQAQPEVNNFDQPNSQLSEEPSVEPQLTSQEPAFEEAPNEFSESQSNSNSAPPPIDNQSIQQDPLVTDQTPQAQSDFNNQSPSQAIQNDDDLTTLNVNEAATNQQEPTYEAPSPDLSQSNLNNQNDAQDDLNNPNSSIGNQGSLTEPLAFEDQMVEPQAPNSESTEGISIPIQAEEPTSNELPQAEDISQPLEELPAESLPESGSQPNLDQPSQPYFQPTTFEINPQEAQGGSPVEAPAEPSQANLTEEGDPKLSELEGQPFPVGDQTNSQEEMGQTAYSGTNVPISDLEGSPESLVAKESEPINQDLQPVETEHEPTVAGLVEGEQSPKTLDGMLNQSQASVEATPVAATETNNVNASSEATDPNASFSTESIKNEGPMPSVESVFGNNGGNGGDGDKPTPQDYGLPAPKPPNESKNKMILIGSIVGGLVLISMILLFVFLGRERDPYPIKLSSDQVATLSSNITNVMDEKQDMVARYTVTANYENLLSRDGGEVILEEPYQSSGDWLMDKEGNIYLVSNVNGKNNKQTYINSKPTTYTYDDETNKLSKAEGNIINSIPAFIDPRTKSSVAYDSNINSISITGVEEIAGVSTRVYEIRPERGLVNDLSFLGPTFSGSSYISTDASNLTLKIWVGASDDRIYKLDLSGGLVVEGDTFSGEIILASTANYEYRSVVIKNPENEVYGSPPNKIGLSLDNRKRMDDHPLLLSQVQ